jgi:hypothetical protein
LPRVLKYTRPIVQLVSTGSTACIYVATCTRPTVRHVYSDRTRGELQVTKNNFFCSVSSIYNLVMGIKSSKQNNVLYSKILWADRIPIKEYFSKNLSNVTWWGDHLYATETPVIHATKTSNMPQTAVMSRTHQTCHKDFDMTWRHQLERDNFPYNFWTVIHFEKR